MTTFNNLDKLLSQYLPAEQNHDDIIAEIVTKTEQAVNLHFHKFQHEFEINGNPEFIHPVVTTVIVIHNTTPIPISIQYTPYNSDFTRNESAKIVKFNDHDCQCPIYVLIHH